MAKNIENAKQKAMQVFREFSPLSVWSRVTSDDFTVRRFETGFINDIICCELTDEGRKRVGKVVDCTGVVLRFVPEKSVIPVDTSESVTINTFLSTARVSPRLLYITDKCSVFEYINSRHYSYEDDCDPEMVKKLARLLAKFHSLSPPITNRGMVAARKMFENPADLEHYKPLMNKLHLDLLKTNPKLKEKYYSILSQIEIKSTIEKLTPLLFSSGSPALFTHVDFTRSNRLVAKDKSILLIDFDFSNFFPRGMDFGRYFSNYKHKDSIFGDEGFPTDQEMRLFLEEYRIESGKLNSNYLDEANNSIEQLIKESKLFALNLYFMDTLFAIGMFMQNFQNEKAEYFLEGAKNRYSGFEKLRQQLLDQGFDLNGL